MSQTKPSNYTVSCSVACANAIVPFSFSSVSFFIKLCVRHTHTTQRVRCVLWVFKCIGFDWVKSNISLISPSMNFTHTPKIIECNDFPFATSNFGVSVFTGKGQWMALLRLHRTTATLLPSPLFSLHSFLSHGNYTHILVSRICFSWNRIVFILIKKTLLYFHFSDFRFCSG